MMDSSYSPQTAGHSSGSSAQAGLPPEAGRDEPSKRPRRRAVRWAILLFCLLLAVWFGRFAYLRITLRPTPRPEYWEAKLLELDPPGPGAMKADDAFDILWAHPKLPKGVIRRDDITEILYGPWDPARDDIVVASEFFASKAFVDARSDLLWSVKAGWSMPVNLSLNRWGGGFPTVARAWSELIIAHSRWVREQEGDIDTAVEDWIAALRLTRNLKRQRMLMDHLVAWSIESRTAKEMIHAANEPRALIDSALLARRIDDIIGPVLLPADLFRGEWIVLQNYLENVFVRDGGSWLAVSEAAGVAFFRPGVSASPLWNLASPLFEDYESADRFVRGYFSFLDEHRTLVSCREFEQRGFSVMNMKPRREEVLHGFFWLSSDCAIPLRLYYRGRCQLEAALAMLALAEYHRHNGHYPETLDELIPDFLPRLPIDYADRKTLRYRREGNDYVLYSIGSDGKDDGGVGDAWFKSDLPDVVFSKSRRPELAP